MFLKKLRLQNFRGYEDYTLNLTKPDGKPYHFVCFYGPNGCGKTTVLDAIALLFMSIAGRSSEFVSNALQKYIRGNTTGNYLFNKSGQMRIEAVLEDGNKDYTIVLTQSGFVQNDILDAKLWGDHTLKYLNRLVHIIRSDSDLSFHKFQLLASCAQDFETIIADVMRYPVKCSNSNSAFEDYCTDIVITKKNTLVHFKQMSMGERKICKAFSDLINLMHNFSHPVGNEPDMTGWPRIILIDEAETHVYYDRHVNFISSLKRVFKDQQIIATTHSGILIKRFLNNEHDADTELMIDLETVTS